MKARQPQFNTTEQDQLLQRSIFFPGVFRSFIRKIMLAFFTFIPVHAQSSLFIETESFSSKGGWVVDQQFMDQMGSAFLLAHGMGVPVANASTAAIFPSTGNYHVWVRTRDWAPPYGPGRFRLCVNGVTLDTVFGIHGSGSWIWQYGGIVTISSVQSTIALQDETGFEGRCDAVYFSISPTPPPDDPVDFAAFRKTALGFPVLPPDAGTFDIVVVGGGMAGACAAVSAARQGLTVALIHDRPVLGGNNSSEVRVHLGGEINQSPFPLLGNIVREFSTVSDPGNAGPASGYGDSQKLGVIQAESNISLYLNYHATRVEKSGSNMTAVVAADILTGREKRFPASLFVDCTGDGSIGAWAGADFSYGREDRSTTGESLAPTQADSQTMGCSNLWYAARESQVSTFPPCPWALQFSSAYNLQTTKSEWFWETGFKFNQISLAEYNRDYNFRAIYGNWAWLKNNLQSTYGNWRLDWVAFISGKRESRRLLGDVILTQQDVINRVSYSDACVTATWSIDLHYPDTVNAKYFPGMEFLSYYVPTYHDPYPIPYRCLYSRNVTNLFMAGRNISVTHVALGTTRVMRTTGMMGEVVGMAAAICKHHNALPRAVYSTYFDELKNLISGNTPPVPGEIIIDNVNATLTGLWMPSTYDAGYYNSNYIHDGNTDKGNKSATFTPDIQSAGMFEVFMRWTSSSNRATNVPVAINYSGGVRLVAVNEQSRGGTWVSLGSYIFNEGKTGSVTIQTTGTNGYVIVDAVKFTPITTTGLLSQPGKTFSPCQKTTQVSYFSIEGKLVEKRTVTTGLIADRLHWKSGNGVFFVLQSRQSHQSGQMVIIVK